MSLEHNPARTGQASEVKLTGTIDEAAKVLGLGRNNTYELAKRGELPVRRMGGRIIVLWQPLLRMLNGGD
jgi:excisionase family DNA binding protein